MYVYVNKKIILKTELTFIRISPYNYILANWRFFFYLNDFQIKFIRLNIRFNVTNSPYCICHVLFRHHALWEWLTPCTLLFKDMPYGNWLSLRSLSNLSSATHNAEGDGRHNNMRFISDHFKTWWILFLIYFGIYIYKKKRKFSIMQFWLKLQIILSHNKNFLIMK